MNSFDIKEKEKEITAHINSHLNEIHEYILMNLPKGFLLKGKPYFKDDQIMIHYMEKTWSGFSQPDPLPVADFMNILAIKNK